MNRNIQASMRVVLGIAFFVVAGRSSLADDWNQWMGPRRDGVWRETGIVQKFPAAGLPIKWRAPVGLGYAGPAVAGGRVYVFDYERETGELANNPGGRSRLSGRERVQCLDAQSGKVIWQHAYDRPYDVSYAGGPRCTPTVADGKVYTLGAHGDLLCLSADSGKVLWQKSLPQEYAVETPIWGFAAHPLVDGRFLYCVVGGQGSVAVAFDKDTGKELWRALSAPEPGYCPPTMLEDRERGRKQLLIWHPKALNGLDPATGKVIWSTPLEPSYGMSVTAPRQFGDYLFASGIGNVGALFRLNDGWDAVSVVWRGDAKSAVYCCNATPLVDQSQGALYGADCQTGALIAVNLKNGARFWETFQATSGGTRRASHGTAYLVRHADRYFLFDERGDLALAKLSPKGYEELGRFHVLEPTNEAFGRPVVWSHPAFAGRCLFARNDRELVCVDLAAP